MTSRQTLFGLALLFVTAAVWAGGSSDSPAAVLSSVSIFGSASSITADISMRISTPRGNQARVLKAYIQRHDSRVKTYVHMTEPAFLSSMSFLSIKGAGGNEVSWIGTSRGVRRVPSEGSGNERLFDSDFTVEDLSVMTPSRFHLSFLPSTTLNGRNCFVIKAVPRYSGAGYHDKVIFVAKSSHLLVGMDYYSDAGRLLRRFRTLTTQTVDGAQLPKTCSMATPSAASTTVLTFRHVNMGRHIPDRVFNVGNM